MIWRSLRVLMVGYMYPNLDMEDITINFWSYGHTHQFWNVKCDKIEPFNFGQPSWIIFSKTTNLKKEKKKNAWDSYANYSTIFIAVGCRNFRIPVFRSVGPYLTGQVMIEYLVLIFILNYRSLFCQHGQKVPPALILRFWSLTDWHVIQFFAQLPIFHTIWKSHFSRQNSTK